MSRDALVRIVRGKTLRCYERGPQSYGRMVGDCLWRDNPDEHENSTIGSLSCEMLKQGWAVEWPSYSHGALVLCRPVGAKIGELNPAMPPAR